MAASFTSKSENVIGEKWDRCISDTLIKMGGGLALGIVFSVLIFKRKSWPIVFGLGSGTGMGYANCQHLFDHPFLVKPERISISAKATNIETAK